MAVSLMLNISYSQAMARVMFEDFWDLSSQIFQPVCKNERFEIARHRLLTATTPCPTKDLSYTWLFDHFHISNP